MSIVIKNENNVFTAQGEINLRNAKILKAYIQSQFLRYERIILNINDVTKIDKEGISILTSLYYKSLNLDKSFSIVGYGCKDLYDDILMSA